MQVEKQAHDLLVVMAGNDPVKYNEYRGMDVMKFWFHVWSFDDLNKKRLRNNKTEITEDGT